MKRLVSSPAYNSMTLWHHATFPFYTFTELMPITAIWAIDWTQLPGCLLGMLSQACVSQPIRWDWAFRRRGLEEKGAKTECLRQRWNTVLQHWTQWENWNIFFDHQRMKNDSSNNPNHNYEPENEQSMSPLNVLLHYWSTITQQIQRVEPCAFRIRMCVKCFVWVHLRWRGVLPGKTPRSSWVHLAPCQHGIRNEPNCIQKELLNSLASITRPKHGSHLICIAPFLPKKKSTFLSLFWHHNGNDGPSLYK